MNGGHIKVVKNGGDDIIVVSWWMRVAAVVLAGLILAGGVNAIAQLTAIPVLRTRLDHHDELFKLMQEQMNNNVSRMERAIESANMSRTSVVKDLTDSLDALKEEMAEQRGTRRRGPP